MNTNKVRCSDGKGKPPCGKSLNLNEFDHYLAVDWSMKVMAIGHMRRKSIEPEIFERPSGLRELKDYLATLRGRKVLAIEETTTSHWLYVELVDHVDRIILCDAYHNRLLSEGPKSDKIDAGKLCQLLRAGLLKEVFHSLSGQYELRRLVSAYEDVVKAGVRVLNQKACLAQGHFDSGTYAPLILEQMDKSIELYERSKEQYERKFKEISRRNKLVRNLLEISGIGVIGAVKIVALVVDARRFPRAAHYLSYCGLIKHEKLSGGRSYGRRSPRFNHTLKAVYKLAAMSIISGKDNPLRQYYEFLLANGVAEHNARHALARYLARLTYGMLKTGTRYQPFQRRHEAVTQQAA
jgi:transposase